MEIENKIPSEGVLDNEMDTSQDYLATIAELKRNSVSKTEYDKLRQENKNLLQTLVEGGQLTQFESKPPVDIEKLRSELYCKECNLSNLEYVEKTLELRDAIMESGEPDPFLPVSSKNAPTQEEMELAENAAQIFRECIEYADGNSQLFTQELQRRTVDTRPMTGKAPRRR